MSAPEEFCLSRTIRMFALLLLLLLLAFVRVGICYRQFYLVDNNRLL